MAPDSSGKLANDWNFSSDKGMRLPHLRTPPPSGTEGHPKLWLQKCQKDIGLLRAQLAVITGEILAMPNEDAALLADVTTIRGNLLELDFKIVCRLYLLEDTKATEFPLEPFVELP